ncbi:MAG: long-chain fatty acid--CoA ligase [Gemmatimonadota bacterium]|nr:long-chain fatty acid--CoA ligase [Gemmatimonadota bacterium]
MDRISNPADLPESTLTDLFLGAIDRHGDHLAYRYFADSGDDLTDLGFRDIYQFVRAATAGLTALGLSRGDKVAILSENRWEWAVSDFACLCSGVLDVPIYSTLTVSQTAYIVDNSQARLLFVSTSEQVKKAKAVRRQLGADIKIVAYDRLEFPSEGVISWEEFLAPGWVITETDEEHFRVTAGQARPDDVATILYTSGTTGDPKGVMLTHNNLASNVTAVRRVIPSMEDDISLVFLPLSHVLQRMVSYLHFAEGTTQDFAHSMDTVAHDLTVVRPSVVTSVPRLYEKVYNRVMGAEGLKKKLVQWSRKVGDEWAEETLAGHSLSVVLRLKYGIADLLVFRKIRKAVGGRIRYFVSGGAPLAPDINLFFFSAGVWIFEGYGLTETSPVTNCNTFEDFKIGTVGKPIPGTEIGIGENGEILVRGPQVMKGYYNLHEQTAKVLDPGGWFHTGDVGEIDEDGFLTITDRIKDIIVTAGGKNVAPQPIENLLKTNNYIEQAVMIGDRRPFCVLLVVPSFTNIESWARKVGLDVTDRTALLGQREVQDLMEGQILDQLEELARYETPKKIGLLESPFTIENGALTPTQKVKRSTVESQYRKIIDAFYLRENMDQTVFVEP